MAKRIDDLGEKIGGARKDEFGGSAKSGKKGARPDGPAAIEAAWNAYGDLHGVNLPRFGWPRPRPGDEDHDFPWARSFKDALAQLAIDAFGANVRLDGNGDPQRLDKFHFQNALRASRDALIDIDPDAARPGRLAGSMAALREVDSRSEGTSTVLFSALPMLAATVSQGRYADKADAQHLHLLPPSLRRAPSRWGVPGMWSRAMLSAALLDGGTEGEARFPLGLSLLHRHNADGDNDWSRLPNAVLELAHDGDAPGPAALAAHLRANQLVRDDPLAAPVGLNDPLWAGNPRALGVYERMAQLIDLPFLARFTTPTERALLIDLTLQHQAMLTAVGRCPPVPVRDIIRSPKDACRANNLSSPPYPPWVASADPKYLHMATPWTGAADIGARDTPFSAVSHFTHPLHYDSAGAFRTCLPPDCPMPRFGVVVSAGTEPDTVILADTRPTQPLDPKVPFATLTVPSATLDDPDALRRAIDSDPINGFAPFTGNFRKKRTADAPPPRAKARKWFSYPVFRRNGYINADHPHRPAEMPSDGTTPSFIGFKVRGVPVPLSPILPSADAAYSWARHFGHAKLQRVIQACLRNTPMRPAMPNPVREGPSHLGGRNATSRDFLEFFGFRAVEWGNWVTQSERIQAMNHHFESLMDLAEVLDVHPSALSLNGRLALSVGARGRGGKTSAHYEPDRKVIHLTKTKGAGSLAHEFFHALDHITASAVEAAFDRGEASELPPPQRNDFSSTFRPAQVLGPEADGAYATRSFNLDSMTRRDPYYSLGHEKTARAFEDHVLRRLAAKGQRNDHLVTRTSVGSWGTERFAEDNAGVPLDYPYPLDDEAEAFAPHIESFARRAFAALGLEGSFPERAPKPEPPPAPERPEPYAEAPEPVNEGGQMGFGF